VRNVVNRGRAARGALRTEPSWTKPAAFAFVLATAVDARALPTQGAARPDVALEDAWDRAIHLERYLGMPMLVLYEDKGSTTENAALKAELARLAEGDRYKERVALVAVADVTGYDYWPVRGFVKSAIRDESRKQKTPIYCDWDGHVRRALDLEQGTSNVLLFGRDGKVLFAHAGPLSEGARAELLARLRSEVGP
jgi:hypothetical protein